MYPGVEICWVTLFAGAWLPSFTESYYKGQQTTPKPTCTNTHSLLSGSGLRFSGLRFRSRACRPPARYPLPASRRAGPIFHCSETKSTQVFSLGLRDCPTSRAPPPGSSFIADFSLLARAAAGRRRARVLNCSGHALADSVRICRAPCSRMRRGCRAETRFGALATGNVPLPPWSVNVRCKQDHLTSRHAASHLQPT